MSDPTFNTLHLLLPRPWWCAAGWFYLFSPIKHIFSPLFDIKLDFEELLLSRALRRSSFCRYIHPLWKLSNDSFSSACMTVYQYFCASLFSLDWPPSWRDVPCAAQIFADYFFLLPSISLLLFVPSHHASSFTTLYRVFWYFAMSTGVPHQAYAIHYLSKKYLSWDTTIIVSP